jgi:hypothetical protein
MEEMEQRPAQAEGQRGSESPRFSRRLVQLSPTAMAGPSWFS